MLLAPVLVSLLACSTPAPSGGEPVATVATQGGNKAKEELDAARVKADLGAIRSTIKVYRQTNEGELPPDLDALELSALAFPGRYVYDASTGTVTDPEHPAW